VLKPKTFENLPQWYYYKPGQLSIYTD